MMKCVARIFALVLVLAVVSGTAAAVSYGTDPVFRPEDLFTERDLVQVPDLTGAESVVVADGQDYHITKEGTYVFSGTAAGMTVYVEAGAEDKVNIVLDGLSVSNTDFPCIYIITADKVFITTVADSSLSVTGAFRKDGSTKLDGVIFSKQDTVLNGTAALSVYSSANGIVCKDDLKITGGTYTIQAGKKALSANDSVRIADGVFSLAAGTDGIHAENKDEDMLGYVYIGGGSFSIIAGDDGIAAASVLQIDGGVFIVSSKEGFNAPVVQVTGAAR